MDGEPVVFIVDDDRAVRESLEWLLGSAGLKYQSFDAAAAFLQRLDQPARGCLVLDMRLPGLGGQELLDEMRRRKCDLPAIVITGHGDVSMAVRAMKSGALDFLEKPFDDQVLLDRINDALARDRRNHSDDHSRRVFEERAARLTRRERQVMDMIVRGQLNKQIAAELGLSPKTVEVHRARVMKKMEAGTFAELVRMVLHAQFTPLPTDA